MAKPIKLTVHADFKEQGDRRTEIPCDDAIIIFSNVNGAVMNTGKQGDGSLTRQVDAYCVGFPTQPDMMTRLSQAILPLIMQSEDAKINQYNMVNLLQFLITNSGLEDKVKLYVSEELIANTEGGKS